MGYYSNFQKRKVGPRVSKCILIWHVSVWVLWEAEAKTGLDMQELMWGKYSEEYRRGRNPVFWGNRLQKLNLTGSNNTEI